MSVSVITEGAASVVPVVTEAETPAPVTVVTAAPAVVSVVGVSAGAVSKKVAYVHEQVTPSMVWTITHGLTFVPNVGVYDSAGSGPIHGGITVVSPQVLSITFSVPFAGTAYCS